MNERIKELASQVLDELVPETWTALKYDKIKEIQFRTAELIVKECMKICQNHPSIIFKNEWDADVVAPDIVNRLESHFGVEK